MAMIAYNSSENKVLKTSPFFANYRYNVMLTHDVLNQHPLSENAQLTANELKELHSELQLDMQ